MKKVLLLGAQGMLGSEIFNTSLNSETIEILPFSRFNLDLTKENEIVEALQNVFSEHAISSVINASAYTLVDKCEELKGKELSIAINAIAPKFITEACKMANIPLFHFSTDYVFSGDTNQSFNENDEPNPAQEYGASKLAGEKAVLAYEKGFVLRTAWLAGQYGHNFVHKIIHLCKTQNTLKIVKSEWGSPSFSHDIAESILKIVASDTLPENKILHCVNERGAEYKGGVSRIDFVQEIINFLEFDTVIEPVKSFDLPAPRPISSVLNNNFIDKLPDWKKALHVFLQPEKEKLEKKRKVEAKKQKAVEKYRAQQEKLKAERAERAEREGEKQKDNK